MTPDAARTLLRTLHAHGWTARATEGTGTVPATTYGEPRGDGTRPQLVIDRPCTSVAVRARRDLAALAAVWISTGTTTKGAPSWKFDQGWNWTVCADPACPNAGHPHPDALPARVTRAQLADVAVAGSTLDVLEVAA